MGTNGSCAGGGDRAEEGLVNARKDRSKAAVTLDLEEHCTAEDRCLSIFQAS